MSWQKFQNIPEILRFEHERRALRNPSYSLRAFSRDIGLTPAHLNEIMQGRSGLSEEKASLVMARIGATESEADWFRLLVQRGHSRSARSRQLAKKAMTQILASRRKLNYVPVRRDGFRLVSRWYHLAILELFSLTNFVPKVESISTRLGISLQAAKQALENLRSAKLLEVDGLGRLYPSHENSETSSAVPEESIRDYHRQILLRATESVNLPNGNRELGALTLAVKLHDLEKAKKRIREFRQSFNREFGVDREGDEVFCLSVQFFPLTKSRGSNEDQS